jgi:hypothetical protein
MNKKLSHDCACRQAGFLPIIILLFLTLVAGGVYYFGTKNKQNLTSKGETVLFPTNSAQPTSTSIPTSKSDLNTTNWKELNNTIYGYSLKYPQSLVVDPGIEMPPYNTISTSREIVITQDGNSEGSVRADYSYPMIAINTINKSQSVMNEMSLQEIAQSDLEANEANSNTVTRITKSLQKTTFAGEIAFTFQMQSKGFGGKWLGFSGHQGINNVLEFEHNDIQFTIFYSEDPVFGQILSTLKFTN